MRKDGNLTLTIHGLADFNGEVDGEVFAEKFSAFIKGLAISDETANGERRHKFVIAALIKNTATASIAEYQTKSGGHPTHSGIDYYEAGVEEVRLDSPAARLLPLELVRTIVTLNKGVGQRFEFGEIKAETGKVIRIDKYLADRAERVLADMRRKEGAALAFEGTAYGSFDGVLRAVDFQPTMKRGTLRLTAGDLPIVCNITHVSLEEITASLEKRAVVYGLAHYDGKGGLPKLLDIQRIEVMSATGDLNRWRGAFEVPSDQPDHACAGIIPIAPEQIGL